MSAYLQTWTDGTQAAMSRQGELLEYAASNQYARIGLRPGDSLFIGYLDDGYLHLIGRMRVAEVINQIEAIRRRGEHIWPARLYAVADRGQSGRVLRSRRVPLAVVRQLRFQRSTGVLTKLNPDTTGRLDGKSLQAIRRLTHDSAELLSNLL
jgi:hypothetical protein